jgi:hypothetical protein
MRAVSSKFLPRFFLSSRGFNTHSDLTMTPAPTNDLSGQYKQIPPFAEWPGLTYGARLQPGAFVIDLRFDTASYFSDAGTEGPPVNTEKAVTDLHRYADAEDALSHAPRLLLAVPDVAAWDSAHHILSFTRAVLDAFYAMLNDGSRPEPVTKSISLPSAALSDELKGLRPLALYLWDRPWRPDPFGPMPTRGNSGLEFPFGVIPDAELEAWVTTYENKTPHVKMGCSENNERKILWLVPFGTVEGGCSLSGPAFFGLRPLSAALQSRPDVPVRQYVSGQSLWSHDTAIGKRSVKDIDLNVLAGSFVEALDRHPSDAVAAARQAVANQRARQELATLFTDTGHEDLLAQAQWWLQGWLEEKSGRANTLAAVLVAELRGVEAPAGVELLTEAVPVGAGQMLAVSQGSLNFRENKTWFISACSADTANRADHKALPLECSLRVTGAANPFPGEGDIRLYHPVTLPKGNGPLLKANVPVLLQTLPMPALIMQQQALASEGDATADAAAKLLESRLWDYRIAYDRHSAVQDTLIVRLDTGDTGASVMNATLRPDLFDALVEFSEAYVKLRIDLEQEDVMPQARESFEWLALNVCNAWMYRTQMMRMKQQASYRIAEAEGEDGTLRVAITGAEGPGVPQPLPRYEGYTAERTGEDWRFRSDVTQRYLSFADRNWHLRSLVFEKLDVLEVESARAELALERNLLPVDGRTPNPDFALRTGFMGPGAAAAPFLVASDPIDISGFGQTVSKRIEVFFTRLFGDTAGRWLRLTVSYGYEAGAGMPVTMPVLLLPKEAYVTGLAARVATAIDEWKQRHLPDEPQSGAFFELDLTVFGMLEQRGVLRVRGSYRP